MVWLEEQIRFLEGLGVDFADIRYFRNKTISVVSGEAKSYVDNNGVFEGYSIRVLREGSFFYSVSSSLSKEALEGITSTPPAAGGSSFSLVKPRKDRVWIKERYPNDKKVEEVMRDVSKLKGDLLKLDDRIKSVNVRFAENEVHKSYMSTDGRDIEMEYKISSLYISAIAVEAGVKASAHSSLSTYLGYPFYTFNIEEEVNKLGKRIKNQLRGRPPKAGEAVVILSPEVSGVFAHEALGHLAEADLFIDGILGRMKGKRIAKEIVSVTDSPLSRDPMAIGITPYDDEGIEGREVKIIEKGVVKEAMNNRLYASVLGEEPTGNGRAESHQSTVLVRMRNTYFEPGDSSFEELIEGVKDGYLMNSVLGGQTSPDGTFQFGIEEGFKVENGEIKYPLRNVGIAGYTIETLSQISGVSKDLSFWPGVCGKEGQRVFVGTGGPYLRVEKMKVGGLNG